MLSITPSGSSSAAKDYFAKSLSKGDYYVKGNSNEVEIVGLWHGEFADKLGLSGNVTQEQFNALADNINPVTGEKLTSRNVDNRISGYDFTFNAPKSLSLLYEITQDERLLDSFRDAVASTMSHIEEDMETRVRKNGLNENRTTGNMIWGEFIHSTSRPVDGIPDPHMHVHAYAFNCTYDSEENQIKAGKFRNIKRDANYYEAYFHSKLSNQLSEMGLDIERKGRFWEIADLERSTIEKFSRRTLQVEETANEYGITNNITKSKLARYNREAKNDDITKSELQNEWDSRLTDDERNAIWGAFDNDSSENPLVGDPRVGITPEEAKNHAIKHCFERSSVVEERKLEEQAMRFSYGSLTPEDINNGFATSGSPELIKKQLHGKTHFTTREVLNEEKAMVDYVRNGFNTKARLNADYEIQTQNNEPNNTATSGWEFEGEAKAAIEHILTSRDNVIALQGYAGTGKTTLMAEAIRGIEYQNNEDANNQENEKTPLEVFTFAPSSDAVEVLKTEGFENSNTVARLELDEKLQKSLENNVIWIDEAGLLSVPQMKRVFDIADEQNARVILGGDVSQHKSVIRGDAFRVLQDEAGLEPATITDIRRQKPKDYRQAVLNLAEGNAEEGFAIFDKRGAIEEINTDERYLKLASEYVQAINDGKSALVVSPTHFEGGLVTDEIRKTLKEQGKIGQDDQQYTGYHNLSWTQSQREDVFGYEDNHVIRYVQNASGKTKGDCFKVVGRNEQNNVLIEDKNGTQSQLNLDDSERFNVYTAKTLNLAEGDTVRITENSLTQDGKHKLNNGSLYQVAGFTRHGDIKTTNGFVIDAERGNLAHGFVTTSHASQGKTVDSVFIAQSSDSFGASSLEQFYVSASRGREEIKIFTDDKQNLLEAVKDSNKRVSAMEFVKDEPKADREAKESLYLEIVNNAKAWGNSAMEEFYSLTDLIKNGIQHTLQHSQPPTSEHVQVTNSQELNNPEIDRDR